MSEVQVVASQSNPPKSVRKYWVVIILLLVISVGAVAAAIYYRNQSLVTPASAQNTYYSEWQADENRISTLNRTIQSNQHSITVLNGQIATDEEQITGYRQKMTSLNATYKQQIAEDQQKIANLNADVATYKQQISNYESQIATDKQQIADYQAQIATYQSILGLKKSTQFVNGTTINEPACGGTGNPVCRGSSACNDYHSCIPDYIVPDKWLPSFCSLHDLTSPVTCQISGTEVHAGVLLISWTSTQPFTVSFVIWWQSKFHQTKITSDSTSAGDYAFPVYGMDYLNGFHNDSCHAMVLGDEYCNAISLTYSETFYY